MFTDGKKYEAIQGLWELLTKSKPDRNLVSLQDEQAYKKIIIQSNPHRVNYSPYGKIKALNMHGVFRNCLLTQRKFLGNRHNNNVIG